MVAVKRQVKRTLAFATREYKLRVRYRWQFVSRVIVMPLLHAMPLIVLYWGLMSVAPSNISGITPDNYLSWVLLGSVVYSTFILGFSIFKQRFLEEKYWMTIYGTLIAPVSKYYLLFGVIIELGLEGVLMSLPFIVISFIVMPINALGLILIYLIFILGMKIRIPISLKMILKNSMTNL